MIILQIHVTQVLYVCNAGNSVDYNHVNTKHNYITQYEYTNSSLDYFTIKTHNLAEIFCQIHELTELTPLWRLNSWLLPTVSSLFQFVYTPRESERCIHTISLTASHFCELCLFPLSSSHFWVLLRPFTMTCLKTLILFFLLSSRSVSKFYLTTHYRLISPEQKDDEITHISTAWKCVEEN